MMLVFTCHQLVLHQSNGGHVVWEPTTQLPTSDGHRSSGPVASAARDNSHSLISGALVSPFGLRVALLMAQPC